MRIRVTPLVLVEPRNEAHQLVLLRVVHAGHRLVEQQQLRFDRHGAPELDALLQAVGKCVSRLACDRAQAQELHDLGDALAMALFLRARRAQTHAARDYSKAHQAVASHEDIVLNRHAAKEREILEGARDAHAGERDACARASRHVRRTRCGRCVTR